MPSPSTSRLFCDDDARERILARHDDTLGAALHRRFIAVTDPDPAPDGIAAGYCAAGHAIRAWLNDNAHHAQRSAARVAEVLDDRWPHVSNHVPDGVKLWDGDYKMIIRSDPAVGVAIALSYAGDRWDYDFRRRVARALITKGNALIQGGGQGWTDQAVSNWHANTRSAAGLCALAAHGLVRQPEVDAILAQAKSGVDAFLATCGERGWHQESWHYYRNALGHHLLPFALAWRHRCDEEAFNDSPLPLMPLLFPFARVGDQAVLPHRQRPLANTHFHSGELLAGVGLVPSEYRASLSWELQDRCGDEHGSGDWDVFHPHHALLGLLHMPAEGHNPGDELGHDWVDHAKGLYLWRHRFGLGGLLAVDANRASQPGTGRPSCAGAFTFAAGGAIWAAGATVSRPRRNDYNCTLSEECETLAGATELAHHSDGTGTGSLSLDMSAVHPDCPGQRHFAISWSDAGEAELRIEDRFSAPVQWHWHGPGIATLSTDGWQVSQGAATMQVHVEHGGPVLIHQDHDGYRVELRGRDVVVVARVGP